MAVPLRLAELARAAGGELVGDADREISAVRSLERAGADDLSFLAHSRYRPAATKSGAGALLVSTTDRDLEFGGDLIVCEDPQRALALVLAVLHPTPERAPGIHPTAVIGRGCEISDSAHVGPYAVIGEATCLGERAVVNALVAIGSGCTIGDRAVLHPHSVLYDGVQIGADSIVHAGAILGADGFGFATEQGQSVKVPQVGSVVLEEEVEVGANSAIDRATLEATRIGRGTKIDNLVQIGHNVELGKGCILCGQSGVSGSTKVGDGVVFAGQTGAAGHLTIGDGVQIAAKSAVLSSVDSGAVGGVPAIPLREWKRQVAMRRRMVDLKRRLDRLEKTLRIDRRTSADLGDEQ